MPIYPPFMDLIKNLFPQQDQGVLPPMTGGVAPMGQDNPDQDTMNFISQRMSQLYQPDTFASDRVNQLLDQIPERPNPSLARKIFASMATLNPHGGGPNAADEVLFGGYNNQMQDWKNQFQPALQAGNLERYSNANNRMAATSTIQQELRSKEDRDKQELNDRKQTTAERRADAYIFKQTHPNWKPLFPKGGTVMFVDPTNPRNHMDTGIPTGTLSDYDRISLMGDERISQIQETGSEARKTEETRQTNREDLERLRQTDRERLKQTLDPNKGAGGSTYNSENQKRIGEFRKAREAYNTKPEWQKWIKLGDPGSNDFTISPPSTAWYKSGPDQATYDEMTKFIYGASPTTNPTSAPPAGWMVLTKPDGTKVKVPAKDIPARKAEGWK